MRSAPVEMRRAVVVTARTGRSTLSAIRHAITEPISRMISPPRSPRSPRCSPARLRGRGSTRPRTRRAPRRRVDGHREVVDRTRGGLDAAALRASRSAAHRVIRSSSSTSPNDLAAASRRSISRPSTNARYASLRAGTFRSRKTSKMRRTSSSKRSPVSGSRPRLRLRSSSASCTRASSIRLSSCTREACRTTRTAGNNGHGEAADRPEQDARPQAPEHAARRRGRSLGRLGRRRGRVVEAR